MLWKVLGLSVSCSTGAECARSCPLPACAGYESISVLSKHGGLAPLRIGFWRVAAPGQQRRQNCRKVPRRQGPQPTRQRLESLDPEHALHLRQRAERQAQPALLARQQTAFQASLVGRTLPVLVEKPGRLAGQMVGRSPYLNAVHLLAPAEAAGTIVHARIVGTETNSLSAERVAA